MNEAFELTHYLERYRAAAGRRLPGVPEKRLWGWSLSETDAFVLGLFLESCPPDTTVLNVVEREGVSTLFFASRPNVAEVVTTTEEPNSEVLDAMLPEFPEEARKIRPRGEKEKPAEDSALVLAFVDRLHTRAEVRKDLKEVLTGNPRAIALLTGCRSGPFVAAGVADFVEGSDREFCFRFLADLGPGLAASGLGVLYPGESSGPAERVLEALGGLFADRLDPLRLLERENELVEVANAQEAELRELRSENEQWQAKHEQLQAKHEQLQAKHEQLQTKHGQLQAKHEQLRESYEKVRQNNARLTERYSGRPYRLLDAVAGRAGRLAGAKRPPQDGGAGR